MKFRKKPVVIEAKQLNPLNQDEAVRLAVWANPHLRIIYILNKLAYAEIKTLEGVMRAEPGDWIIKDVRGEFYPCKPDIFEQTYEPVGDE